MADEFEERIVLWAFYLVLVVIVVFGAIYSIDKFSGEVGASNKFVNVDNSLLLKTIELSPGKVDLNYHFGNLKLKVKPRDINILTSLKDKSNLVIKNTGDIWPVDSKVITSCYGERNIEEGTPSHEGVDIRANNLKVRAIQKGKIISYKHGKGTNNALTIINNDGTKTRYLHLKDINENIVISEVDNPESKVRKFDCIKNCGVDEGEIIATSGSHGPTGPEHYDPHLHFEVIDGKAKDPLQFRYNPQGFKYKKGSNCLVRPYASIVKERLVD
tara:strand:+ start:776 stop:1591 length:816 start_codon:yes stop_codon:yes gene_type:complete